MMIPRRPQSAIPPAEAFLTYERTDPDGAVIYRIRLSDPNHLQEDITQMLVIQNNKVVHSQDTAPITVEIPRVLRESA